MLKPEREELEKITDAAWARMQDGTATFQDVVLVEANKYIMKLERDLYNCKNKRKVASLLRNY